MRFPIKSLLGETLDECAISSSGLNGDRALALVDTATGKIASAKQPNLWRNLLKLSARTDTSNSRRRITVTNAAGSRLDHLDEKFDLWLSELLGRNVQLIETRPDGLALNRARPDEVLERGIDEAVTQDLLAIGAAAPDGGFFDFAPIHLMTATSLDAICSFAPEASISAERYRPNSGDRDDVRHRICREPMGRPTDPIGSIGQARDHRSHATLRGAAAFAWGVAGISRRSWCCEQIEQGGVSTAWARTVSMPRSIRQGAVLRLHPSRRSGLYRVTSRAPRRLAQCTIAKLSRTGDHCAAGEAHSAHDF